MGAGTWRQFKIPIETELPAYRAYIIKVLHLKVPIESELPAYCAYIIKVSNIISQQRISTNLSCPEAR